jgi:hypothetical protein
LVQSFQYGHALFAFDQMAQPVSRKWPEHHQIDHSHLDPACFPQIVRDSLRGRDHAPLAKDQVVRVVGSMTHHTVVSPTSERMDYIKSQRGQFINVIKKEGSLGSNTLHIRILILH